MHGVDGAGGIRHALVDLVHREGLARLVADALETSSRGDLPSVLFEGSTWTIARVEYGRRTRAIEGDGSEAHWRRACPVCVAADICDGFRRSPDLATARARRAAGLGKG